METTDNTQAAAAATAGGTIEPVIEQQIEKKPEAEQTVKLEAPNIDDEVRRNVARMWQGRKAPAAEQAHQDDGEAPAVPPHILAGYVQVGNQYHHKDSPDTPAFADAGHKLETSSNSDRIASDLVAIAEHRGWSTIRVGGAEDFKRQVWLEASLKGMGVEGFQPNDQDKAQLVKLAAERNVTLNSVTVANTIEQAAERSQQLEAEPSQPAKRQEATKARETKFEGTLLEHGAAPYQFDEKEQPNYYAKMRRADGSDFILWGKDIENALADSGAKVGQKIGLEYLGKTPVTVQVPVRDDQGNHLRDEKGTLRFEPKDTHVNKWQASIEQGQERSAALEQAAERFPGAKITAPTEAQQEKGTFAGKIVAQDERHVVQQTGANALVAHERAAIDHQGAIPAGQFVKVQYGQGRAQIVSQDKQQQRAAELAR